MGAAGDRPAGGKTGITGARGGASNSLAPILASIRDGRLVSKLSRGANPAHRDHGFLRSAQGDRGAGTAGAGRRRRRSAAGLEGDAEERLDKVPGVVESHLEAVCCEDGKVLLYVGIEERGAPHFDLREPPEGDEKLPEEITGVYRRFLDAVQTASRRGIGGEDLTQGYSRVADLAGRAIQDMFPVLATDHFTELRTILHNSDDELQRATAAYVIAYAADRKAVVNELQFALKDADPGVRANAVRA